MFKKLIIPLIAVITAVGFAFGTSQSQHKKTFNEPIKKALVDHTFYFKANSGEDDISDPQAYQSTPPEVTCSGGDLPCEISVPDMPNTTPEEDLETYLQNTSPEDVVSNAISTRP